MREHLRGVSIANRIRMARAAHAGSFLIVEGEDDKKLFQQLIGAVACRVQIAHGKPNLLAALDILDSDGFPGVLAIADADCCRLDCMAPQSPNLLWTDTHDLETLLILSPAFERLLIELGDDAKLQAWRADHGQDLRGVLLAAGAPIGYLRWLSAGEDLGWLFDDLPVEQVLIRGTLTVDWAALLAVLQGRSRQGSLVAEEIWARIEILERLTPDPWQICCGHDLVRILSHALCRLLGSNKESDVTPARLEMALRLAYTQADFQRTSLRAEIAAWEQRSSPFAVLPRSAGLSPA